MNHGTNNVTICAGNTNCSNTDTKTTSSATCSSCVAQKNDLDSSDAYTELIYTLEDSYTVSLTPPTITMSFGTLLALSASDVGALCNIWAEEPVFSVNIK